MNKATRPIYIFSFLFLMILSSIMNGQVINPQSIPPGVDLNQIPQNIPQGQLPNLKQRVIDLQKAGLSKSEIAKRLGIPLSGIPGVTSPIAPIQNQNNPTNSNSTTSPQEQSEITIEGDEAVLDEEDSEFQDKPKDSQNGYLSPPILSNVFGHKIFGDSTRQFEQTISPTPTPDYIVGRGDIFTVTIWGTSELSERLIVADDGSVQRQYMGKVYLAGLTYTKALSILRQRYRGLVSSSAKIEIFMGASRRTIQVNIVGEVFRPNSYTINAAIPAFSALFKAGGVTDIGSVRNILIKRNGRTVQVLDIYDYLIRGNDEPIYLQDNDFIYVPVQEKIVEVEGAVKRPMEYELKEEENLKALIEFAGGLNYDAMRSDAQIARLESEREVLVNFHMDSILANPNKDFRIKEGDKLIVKTLNKGAFNIVQAFGDLEYPGTYQLLPGEKVSDLIRRAGGLGIDAYMDRAYVVRIMPSSNEVLYIPLELTKVYSNEDDIHDLELQYFDALIVFAESDFRDERYINISGEIRKPGIFKVGPTMTLKDLLFISGGPSEDADLRNVELTVIAKADHLANKFRDQQKLIGEGVETEALSLDEEVDPEDQIVRRIAIDENWRSDSSIDTMLIYEFDQIKIYSKYDFKNFKYIEIEGAVKNPGRFPLKKGMTIKDLLYLSGGLTENADVNEVEMYRDIDYEEMGHYGVKSERAEIQRITIEEDWRTGTISDTFLVEGFKKMVVRTEDEFFNQGFVEVKGLVNKPGRFPVSPNMTLMDLFYMAGGPQLSADFDQVELSRVIEVFGESGEIIPVPIDIQLIPIDQDWQDDSTLANLKVNSFDQVFVRKNPDFELQESVYVLGEVITPGEFNKASKAEKLSSLVARAGGITDLAYLEGAYLIRPFIGKMSIKLDKVLNRRNSKFDIPLLVGDTLVIPPRTDVVSIVGNVLQPGTTVLYDKGKKRFKYYVRQAGGFARKTKKKRSTAAYVDGRVKSVRRFLFFKKYPKIAQGTVINVAKKPEKNKAEKEERREKITLQEVLATATSLLTFLVLLDRVRN